MDSSLGEGLVVGGDIFLFLFCAFESGLSGDGVKDALGSYGGGSAGLRSLGDFCVAQFWMFVDFGDGHESFGRQSLAVEFRRESPWERVFDGSACCKEAFFG